MRNIIPRIIAQDCKGMTAYLNDAVLLIAYYSFPGVPHVLQENDWALL